MKRLDWTRLGMWEKKDGEYMKFAELSRMKEARADVKLLISQWSNKNSPVREIGELAYRILTAIFG